MIIKLSSTARPLVFLMVDSTDHITGKTGLSPTVTLSKNGAAFASPAGAVTEIANGWYKVAGNATDTNTVGSLILHATGTAADPVDIMFEVVAFDPDDAVRLGLSSHPNVAAGAVGGLPLSVDTSGRVDVLKINGTSQTARDIGASVLLSSGAGTGQLDFTGGVVKANAVQLLGTAWLTPGTAGTPDVNVKLWNGLATVALPLVPTTAGRTLDVSAGGEAGVDWANVGSPTTTVSLSGTTVGTVTTLTGHTAQTGDAFARIGAAGAGLTALGDTRLGFLTGDAYTRIGAAGAGLTAVVLAGTQTFSNTGTWTGNIVGTLSTLTTYTGNTPQTGDSYARIGATGSGLTSLAPASTALSTATWTGAKAAFLDAAVTSRMATFTLPTRFSSMLISTDGYVSADLVTIGGLPVFASGSSVSFPEIVSGLTSSDVATELGTFMGTAGANLTALAPASTALSNATWTDTKAGYLDAAISSVSLDSSDLDSILTIVERFDSMVQFYEGTYRFYPTALTGIVLVSGFQREGVPVTLPDPAPAGYGGGTPPTAAAIADAVWDEALSGHLTAGTTGAALSASGSAGDPWSTAIPGDYAEGTAGFLINKLDVGEPEESVIVIPAPAADSAVCRVYGYMETIENRPAANVLITFRLSPDAAAGWRSDKMLVNRSVSVRTDANGRIVNSAGAFYVELQRNDDLATTGTLYHVSCPELWDGPRNLTLSTDLYDLKGIS